MSQYEIVKTIQNAGGACSIERIFQEVDCTQSTVHSMINRLERKKIITKAGMGHYEIAQSATREDIERLKPVPLESTTASLC